MTALTCPTPDKVAHKSRSAANRMKHVGSGGKRMRAYLCRCGFWHLASWTNDRDQDAA